MSEDIKSPLKFIWRSTSRYLPSTLTLTKQIKVTIIPQYTQVQSKFSLHLKTHHIA